MGGLPKAGKQWAELRIQRRERIYNTVVALVAAGAHIETAIKTAKELHVRCWEGDYREWLPEDSQGYKDWKEGKPLPPNPAKPWRAQSGQGKPQ